jgi:hypothetical protein
MMLQALGAIAEQGAGGFNPETDITWQSLYWTEGTAFKALGLADGDSVPTWPNEVSGGTDLTESTNPPTYDASDSVFGTPAIVMSGIDDKLNAYMAVAQPFTAVVISRNVSANRVALWLSGQSAFFGWIHQGSWRAFAGGSFSGAVAGDQDAHIHTFYAAGAPSEYLIDGSGQVENAGTQDITRLTVGTFNSTYRGTGQSAVFVGVKNGAFTSTEQSSLLAWSQDHYGTP